VDERWSGDGESIESFGSNGGVPLTGDIVVRSVVERRPMVHHGCTKHAIDSSMRVIILSVLTLTCNTLQTFSGAGCSVS
jgi:hypothetical protein